MDPGSIIGLISGIVTGGKVVVKLIYSAVRTVKSLEGELKGVATRIDTLIKTFNAIKSEMRKLESDSHLSPEITGSISAIIEDTEDLYANIKKTVDGRPSKLAKAKNMIRRKDVEAWDRQISRNVQTLGTLMSTLTLIASWSNTPNAATAALVPTTSIAEQSQAQMYQSALCDEGLALLDESFVDLGANSLDLDENPGLEPQYYI